MKISMKTTGFLLAATCLTAKVVHANPCEDDDGECIAEERSCMNNPEGCCEGLGCYGYNFFKRCQDTPFCLKEWYACNPNPGEDEEAIECCTGFACVTDPKTGSSTCERPQQRNAELDLPGFNIEEHKEPPTPAPPALTTQRFTCEEPRERNARSHGDPHIRTFDGLDYDCHGIGEHILFKSEKTSRMAQGRFTRVRNWDLAVTSAVAVQDQGGAASPIVQVSMPIEQNEQEATVLGDKGCKAQLFVNGEQHTLEHGVVFEDEEVKVTLGGVWVTILYKKSGFTSWVSMWYWNGCLLNTYFKVPLCEGDSISGLLGNADDNAMNDWAERDGSLIPVPASTTDRRRQAAYDFCTQNWCMETAGESIFHYNEFSYDFSYYSRCALKYGQSLVEFLEDLDKETILRCQGDVGCMMDVLDADDQMVQQVTRDAQIGAAEMNENDCGYEESDCSAGNKCCDGYNCVKFSPFDWKCKRDITALTQLEPKCNPYRGGYCDKITCCGAMECADKGDGLFQCETPHECAVEGERCHDDADCCDGQNMQCVNPELGKDAKWKTCKVIPEGKSALNEICFPPQQECTDGLFCEEGSCVLDTPKKWGQTCWKSDWHEESTCADDLMCMPWYERKVCADPGLEKTPEGVRLKKGSICLLDSTIPCVLGATCQKPPESAVEQLVKNLGEEEAAKFGQCRGVPEIRGAFVATAKARFDKLSVGWQYIFDFRDRWDEHRSEVSLVQYSNSRHMALYVVQNQKEYVLYANNAITQGETADWRAGVDSNGLMWIEKNGHRVASKFGQKPVDKNRGFKYVGKRLVGEISSFNVHNQ